VVGTRKTARHGELAKHCKAEVTRLRTPQLAPDASTRCCIYLAATLMSHPGAQVGVGHPRPMQRTETLRLSVKNSENFSRLGGSLECELYQLLGNRQHWSTLLNRSSASSTDQTRGAA
ncbi:hypothetical protein FOZ63_021244, partial [Perkinsus olseni]